MTDSTPFIRSALGGLSLMLLALVTTPHAVSEEAPIGVRIDLPKASYRIGDPFSFTLSATRNCNFIVFTIDADDNVEIHDPSSAASFMGPPVLKAGETRQIPVSGAPGYAVITPPAGNYEIGAVCGRDELSAYGLNQMALTAPAVSGRRGFKFYVDNATQRFDRASLGTVTVSFQISD